MGLFSSSSKSSSNQTTNNTDRRVGAADRAIAATEGSAVNQTIINTVDSLPALSVAAQATKESNITNRIVATQAFNFGTNALASNVKVVDSSLSSVGNVVDRSAGLIETINLRSTESIRDANAFAHDVSKQAINSVEQSTRSDANQSFDKLINGMMIVGVVAFISLAVKK